MKTARDYQAAAQAAVWQYFQEKAADAGDPIVAMPTGTGKSFCIADLIKSMLNWLPHTRVLVLTHVKELIENNYETLMEIMPGAPAGIYSAGLSRKDIHAQITFGGIASIARRAKLFSKTDIIIIDECHLVSTNQSTQYVKFISAIKAFNPKVKVIGYTATPWRMGVGLLTEGDMFDDICFDLTSGEAFIWMIEQGYLMPLIPKQMDNTIDTSAVKVHGGEFASGQMSDEIDRQRIIYTACREAVEKAHDRKHWLVFADS